MGKYEGKTAVVTGGTTGIGFATAKLLVTEGARVLVTGRNERAIEAARSELGSRAVVLRSDTASLADIDALADKARETLGAIDFVFVNAGIAKFVPLEQVTEAFYDETLGINTKGAFFTIQKLAPLVKSGGSFVLNTSVVDELGMPATSVYAASKAALRSLARTLAAELLPRGIRVNAVSPGPIATPIVDKMGLPPEARAGLEAQLREANPMKRFGTPEEVGRAALFLAFDATFSTGAELPVDGGLTQL
jgi:NAD(P)-dependent dehydrogenase (short-subunit alcohol dehydrogenase family)